MLAPALAAADTELKAVAGYRGISGSKTLEFGGPPISGFRSESPNSESQHPSKPLSDRVGARVWTIWRYQRRRR